MRDTRSNAITYTVSVLRKTEDWQEAQHALADHPVYGPWIEAECADEYDAISFVQSIIREAEDRLGEALPY